jgi:hypothetical protein
MSGLIIKFLLCLHLPDFHKIKGVATPKSRRIMKESVYCCLAIFLSLALVGCSGSDDDGGTSGGSGTSVANVSTSTCQSDAGVYTYTDGSRFELMLNCEFIITLPDGSYGHGRVTHVIGGNLSADLVLDTGPSRGTCGTITVADDQSTLTDLHPCS